MVIYAKNAICFLCLYMLLSSAITAYAVESNSIVNRPDQQQKPTIIIDKKEDQTQVRLDTSVPLTPYLGSGGKPPPPEDIVLLIGNEERDSFFNYIHLETGIGVNLNKSMNIDLGYRFEKVPTLLDKGEDTNGQIRFGLQFKY